MRTCALALVVLCAACGSRPALHVAPVRRVPAPPRPVTLSVAPPPRPPPAPRATEAPLPTELVRPRLVGLVHVGEGWGAVIEDSPASGERIVVRAPEDPSRELAPSIAIAPPLAFALEIVGDQLVLAGEPPDDHVYARTLADAAPHVIATLPPGLFTRVSTRAAFAARAGQLGGIVAAREADDDVHPFARPHRVEHEHLTAWTVGGAPHRPLELPLAPGEAIAWLAAAANETESAVVRVIAPRTPTETLDGAAGAVVHITRLGPDGVVRSHAEAATPAAVSLDVIAELAPDGTLAVAFLDAHEGAQALVVVPFGPRGAGAPIPLDVPGPLHDGDAHLVACGAGLYVWTVSARGDALELALQRVLPTTSPRDVVWRGEVHAAEGHVLAAACDGGAVVAALQRAPIITTGSLVMARAETSSD